MQTRFLILLISFALAPFLWPTPSSGQIAVIPGSSDRGEILFRTKACVDCHSFAGVGGKSAPDLAQQNESVRTPTQLASVLWNHGPRMWQAQKARHVQPTLDSAETADLFSYFYSLSYSKARGDAANGARLFTEKGCAGCHETTVGEVPDRHKARLQSPISTWNSVNDPLAWAESMWNHSGKVFAELSSTGAGWPQFSGSDMVDLLAYIRSLPESRSSSAVFQPGDPELGRVTFERSCESCHSFGDRTAEPKIDLLKKPGPGVLTDYVAAMWNHAPLMHSRAGNTFPILGPGDMRNLVAYLFAQRYFDEQGNVQRGARVFEAKNCIVCHEQRRKEMGATDLTLSTERFSPITISAAVWRHGPQMFETIQKQNLRWPELKSSEMSDLIAYLNSRIVPRVAGAGPPVP